MRELRDVAPLGQRDDKGVGSALGPVVLLDACPQPGRFGTDDRIDAWIEVGAIPSTARNGRSSPVRRCNGGVRSIVQRDGTQRSRGFVRAARRSLQASAAVLRPTFGPHDIRPARPDRDEVPHIAAGANRQIELCRNCVRWVRNRRPTPTSTVSHRGAFHGGKSLN
jgi:hypothetical protein